MQIATPVGFEPTRGDPIGLAGRHLNRSAKVSLMLEAVWSREGEGGKFKDFQKQKKKVAKCFGNPLLSQTKGPSPQRPCSVRQSRRPSALRQSQRPSRL